MLKHLHVKYPLFFSDLSKTEFSQQISKKVKIPSFIKIHPVGAELFHTDRRTTGRTDMTNVIAAFRNFANASNETNEPSKGQNESTTLAYI